MVQPKEAASLIMFQAVEVKNGAVYLPSALAEKHFGKLETVILIRREANLLVLPVHDVTAGGYLLKRRNASGDRVIHGADFLRDQGFEGENSKLCDAYWDPASAALVLPGIFAN